MSGFYGDRFSAAREMVNGGPIDVLTGDYLAELTMAILYKSKRKDPLSGYATSFLKQMEEIMGTCLEKNIKVVTNAGGLNPAGLAAALQSAAEATGLSPRIAWIEGDDLINRLPELKKAGESLQHLDRGIPLWQAPSRPISANAYLGCWGVVEALKHGADIVVTGRVADAALVMGPAAWHFNWQHTDWDCLAGAAAAGHVIECGTQATGGNYSFFPEVPSFRKIGFPLAEIHDDGSCVISKHPGTGGLVSIGTVTAQLMYEIQQPGYLTPDVTARFDTIRLTQQDHDRVLLNGVKGEPPTSTAKVCVNNLAGFKNSMTIVLTGLDIQEKARLVEDSFFNSVGGREQFDRVEVQLIPSGHDNPASNEEAFNYLRISVFDADHNKAGRLFFSKIVELALANIPGFHVTAPPADAQPAIVYWPALVAKKHLQQKITLGSELFLVDETIPEPAPFLSDPIKPAQAIETNYDNNSQMIRIPLGRIFATRSGDKGGNANLGVWGQNSEAYSFLHAFLTIEKLKELLPDTKEYEIERYEFPNLLAINFFIRGFLGDGAAASIKMDPQAKTLGEYLRAKIIAVPEALLKSLSDRGNLETGDHSEHDNSG
ncbi:MAG: acyclic terpene utilization AtuA family protein [Xanthomonadaceae bacterium]|nr:acyclic terpene utilization AtuA family protein [Xanthomonadaceae bacterium]